MYSPFSLENIGKVQLEDGPAEVFEFAHPGTEIITFLNPPVWYGCTEHPTIDHRLPRVIGPGERRTVLIRSDDLDQAFVMLIWAERRRLRAWMQWMPLLLNGPLGRKATAQLRDDSRVVQRVRRWLSRWRGAPKRLGPDGALRIALTPRRTKNAAWIAQCMPARPTPPAKPRTAKPPG